MLRCFICNEIVGKEKAVAIAVKLENNAALNERVTDAHSLVNLTGDPAKFLPVNKEMDEQGVAGHVVLCEREIEQHR